MDALLQPIVGRKDLAEDRQVQDLVSQIRTAVASKCGETALAMWPVYWMSIGPFTDVGYTLYARGAPARGQLLRDIDVRSREFALRRKSGKEPFCKVHEAVETQG